MKARRYIIGAAVFAIWICLDLCTECKYIHNTWKCSGNYILYTLYGCIYIGNDHSREETGSIQLHPGSRCNVGQRYLAYH